MVVAAGVLVLVGLGLFVAGLLTGETAFYWSCVGVCAVAAVLLVATRRHAVTDGGAPGTEHDDPADGRGVTRTPAPSPPTGTPTTAAAHPPPSAAVDRPEAAPRAAHGADEPAHRVPPSGATGSWATGSGATVTGATWDGVPSGRAERRRGGAHAAAEAPVTGPVDPTEPGVEQVEVTDLLLVVDLTDEVLVVDERPRYHLGGCAHLAGQETIPLPLDEARTDGFTPCARCAPDRHIAERERARRATRGR